MRKEGINHAHAMINSTKNGASRFFDLEGELMNKTSVLIEELLQSNQDQWIPPLDWQVSDNDILNSNSYHDSLIWNENIEVSDEPLNED